MHEQDSFGRDRFPALTRNDTYQASGVSGRVSAGHTALYAITFRSKDQRGRRQREQSTWFDGRDAFGAIRSGIIDVVLGRVRVLLHAAGGESTGDRVVRDQIRQAGRVYGDSVRNVWARVSRLRVLLI